MVEKKKIITVVGARPQFIKAAVLSKKFASTQSIEEVIIHTGQHFDNNMSNIFFDEMEIPLPKYNLGIGGGTHGQNTGRMIESIEAIFLKERPSVVLVYGDTDSTLAAAIAASKLGIYIAHVEAGLRSFKRSMPEEINRVITDHISDVLYAPSDLAATNLFCEGITKNKVVISGDIMYESVLMFANAAHNSSKIMDMLGLKSSQFNLLTLHRNENTNNKNILEKIFEGLSVSEIPIIFPIHPRTAKYISIYGLNLPKCIRKIEPLGYFDTLALLSNTNLLFTDSGGMQKEAYFLKKPCITLREETEWNELVNLGVNVLVGSSKEKIEKSLKSTNWPLWKTGIYGNGMSSTQIANDLVERFLQ